MAIDQNFVLRQLDDLIAESNKFQRYKHRNSDGWEYYDNVPETELADFLTRIVATIERLTTQDSSYIRMLKTTLPKCDPIYHERIDPYVGILKALRADYAAGYLQSITQLIHADLFGDFLEMAVYLISEGYKDPAAVIAGTVLEGHLRKLCDKNSIPTLKPTGGPKMADALNAELAGANIYTRLDLKNVTAWLDLRNKAAHGHYAEYTKDQVALLTQSIRDFITRNPA